jgi:hypothetical protein
MKKLLLAVLLVSLSVATYAQGTVVFGNTSANIRRVNYNADSGALAGTAAEVGTYTVGLFVQQAGVWNTVSTTPMGYRNNPGFFNPGTVTVNNAVSGSTVNMMLQVWQTSFASYDAQTAAGTGFQGQSDIFSVTLGGGSSPAAQLAFTPFTLHPLVPEPTTIALGLFGVAGLFLARRRQ